MKYALIDMGSNSVRLTVYQVSQDSFTPLFKAKRMASLAGYVEQGRLSEEGMDRACQSLTELTDTIKALDIDRLSVFATASLRNVSNTQQAVDVIGQRTGIQVQVLSGQQEAEYGLLGALWDVPADRGLYADVGGASTEVALFAGGRMEKGGSVAVGSLKLYQQCVKNILPGKGSLERLERAVTDAFRQDVVGATPPGLPLLCVGGTARATLHLCRHLLDLPKDVRTLQPEQVEALYDLLRQNDKAAAQLILRHEPERIHTMVPGLVILRHVMLYHRCGQLLISQGGVREGYLARCALESMK